MASCSARLQSSFLDQTDSDTASDTGTCNHKHADIATAATSHRAGKSVLSCLPVNKAKLIGRELGVGHDARLSCTSYRLLYM